MAKIIILNGAARKNGNTAKLIKAFIEGAASTGNEIKEFYLHDMNIKGCLGCEHCSSAKRGQPPCVQKDDMAQINEAFLSSDVVVFASPVYFWTVTGTLKTAAGADYSQAVRWYETYERNLHWNNLGVVLGTGKTDAAFRLGASIR